ncbi:MAG: ATP-binding protein [Bryobacteraceae bacterium]|nr:ATP-binding protein [Bryobacteraceae bacterium]
MIHFFVVILVCLSAGAAPARTFRIGYENTPPLQERTREGRPAGFAPAIVSAAAEEAGIRLEWVFAPEGPDAAFAARNVDLWPILGIRPFRQGKVYITDPWARVRLWSVYRAASKIDPKTYSGPIVLDRNEFTERRASVRFPNAKGRVVADQLDVLARVCDGSAPLGLFYQVAAAPLTALKSCEAELSLKPIPEDSFEMGVAAALGDPEAQRAARAIFERIVTADPNGEYRWAGAGSVAFRVDALNVHAQTLLNRRDTLLRASFAVAAVLAAGCGWFAAILIRRRRTDDRTRRALAESELRFRTLTNSAPVGIYMATPQSECVYVNDRWSQLAGMTAEEALGTGWANCVHPGDRERVFKEWTAACQSESEWMGECRLLHADGRVVWIASRSTPIRGGDGKVVGYLGTNTDITSLKETEKRLEQVARAKTEFLATMSHEIRTPLNGIVGMTPIIADTDLTAEQRDYLSLIRSSGDVLLTLINDLLDHSKIEAGSLEIETVAFDMDALADESAELLADRAEAKGLELTVHIDPQVPHRAAGDPTRIRQVLLNLLGNAVKFTPSGEVRLEISSSSPGRIAFAVTDTGPGIAPEDLSKLFQPFVQASVSVARRYGGTGLGLTISRRLAEAMGGTLTVETEPGRGARFTLELPLAEAPACLDRVFDVRVWVSEARESSRRALASRLSRLGASMVAHAPAEVAIVTGADGAVEARREGISRIFIATRRSERLSPETLAACGAEGALRKPLRADQLRTILRERAADDLTNLSRDVGAANPDAHRRFSGRILLAEDNLVNQKVAVAHLRRLGFETDIAPTGEEAVKRAFERDYHAILMDCHMPDMDGYEATREIRRRELSGGERRFIVALTANAFVEDRNRCLEAGMDDFLTKPLSAGALERVLTEAARPVNSPQ